MSRGCCLGCVGVTVVLLVAIGAAVYLLDQAFSIFSPSDRVALDQVYGTEYPVVARLDLSSEYLREVTGRSIGAQPWFVDLLWPHEAYFFVDIDEERTRHDLTLAVSTRRMGTLVAMGFPFEEGVTLGGGYAVSNVGLDNRGVLTVLAGGPIEEASLVATEDWTAVVEPYALNGEHLFELVVDNSSGEGYLALRRWFDEEPAVVEEPMPAEEAMTPEERLVDEEPAPIEDEAALTQAEMDQLFQLIGALRIQSDIHENRALRAVFESRYATEEDARTALPLLEKLLEAWKESSARNNATVEGDLERDGTEITGEFILTDVDTAVVEESQERLQELER